MLEVAEQQIWSYSSFVKKKKKKKDLNSQARAEGSNYHMIMSVSLGFMLNAFITMKDFQKKSD